MTDSSKSEFHVAIIGAGITGVNLALALLHRGVRYTIYERSPGYREIGAGIGFSPNAERAMLRIHPEVLPAFKRVANPNGKDYFQWIDGCRPDDLLLCRLFVGENGFQGGRRQDILEEWAKLVPRDTVQFGKEIRDIEEPEKGPLTLHFQDGSTAHASVVVGCDGIRSRVRQLILPPGSPAAHASYTAKYCFRALAPMSAAVASLGPYKPSTRFMYIGPGAHIITYPVGNNTQLNMLAVVSENGSPDPSRWPLAPGSHHTAPSVREELERAFTEECGFYSHTVHKIVRLFPERLDKWAIFDMAENPAPQYHRGRICIAGDAAHASGPHLGAGAGMGIEDALVLSEVIARAAGGGEWLVEKALEAFNSLRYERTQEVVHMTRESCELFHWRRPEVSGDPQKFVAEMERLFHRVWHYDIEEAIRQALSIVEGHKAGRL
ncbi:uncharacterized protein CTHT_0064630 [Thermochaetoides thermophila DSM 1495]|uniref:FAD-binding domain-containing protein n=1 Tax=Chaetomium thermophilum (strain DSM 1495 / CBS 144.50 / IMI 039719) TaxID=759272 RepID=G0SG10_CHATD|nr:hypothetical protein CTHT_0064630 [Thermochaetoides thermophila DSM 1495]EGS17149.1 hypothetical protein CTHT_0064630 [Thermochaetoides thermophila DSM 1495]